MSTYQHDEDTAVRPIAYGPSPEGKVWERQRAVRSPATLVQLTWQAEQREDAMRAQTDLQETVAGQSTQVSGARSEPGNGGTYHPNTYRTTEGVLTCRECGVPLEVGERPPGSRICPGR